MGIGRVKLWVQPPVLTENRNCFSFPFPQDSGRWGKRIVRARDEPDPESGTHVVTAVIGISTRSALDPACQHSSMEKGGLLAPALAESYSVLGIERQFSVRL